MFMLFPPPLLEVIFRETLRRSRPKSAIFIGFWSPARPQNGSLEHLFLPKSRLFSFLLSYGTAPGTDLGTIWCRKRSKNEFVSIWIRFWLILEAFPRDDWWYFSKFQRRFNIDSSTCVHAFPHHQTCRSTEKQNVNHTPITQRTNHFPGIKKSTSQTKKLNRPLHPIET